jgi:predicted deacylase
MSAANPDAPLFFEALHFAATEPGTRLLCTAAVHGNEVCGTHATRRVAEEIRSGQLKLVRGQVTFVPITNPLAYRLNRRMGDRNLNRKLQPTDAPKQFEDRIANWLCPLIARHDVLLDLHSFQAGGQPFVMVGPRDNAGPLQPFARAAEEEALAACLGVGRAVDGWLETYADGVARRREWAKARPELPLDLDERYGIGTTEYMRAQGGAALTLECGQHEDPQAPEVAYRAIINTLAHLGLIDGPAPQPRSMEGLSLYKVVDKFQPEDAFAKAWTSFDPVQRGELIGTRADGTELRAEEDGFIVFPNAKAQAGQEWFYFARRTTRFVR